MHLDAAAAYQTAANKLSPLVEDLRGIEVERDDKRELLTLYGIFRNGERFPARSLSDGTLRFLALAILDMDPHANGVICLEEPENGIHPDRVQDIIRLLKDIAVDTSFANDETNPLRQVIINTHSPLVVANVSDSDLLYASEEPFDSRNKLPETNIMVNKMTLKCIARTWREKTGMSALQKGKIQTYLEPIPRATHHQEINDDRFESMLVRERPDLRYSSDGQTTFLPDLIK